MQLAQKIMNSATKQQKDNTWMQFSQGLSRVQLAEFHSQGKDPLMWFYENQAFQVLIGGMARLEQQRQQIQALGTYRKRGGAQNSRSEYYYFLLRSL